VGGSFIYLMSKQRWKTLPADVQKFLLSVGQDTMKHACREIDKEEK